MNKSSELTKKVFDYLNANANYAVLRNFEELPLKNISRDIDILLEKKEFIELESKIVAIIIASDFKITTLYRSEKIVTYVCANSSNGNADLVQFDFFFNTSLFGLILLDAKNLLNNRLYNGSVYHVSKEHEFLDKYLQLKFLNIPYPDKYQALKDEMKLSNFLPDIIREEAGCNSFDELERLSKFVFKKQILFSNLKKYPIKQIGLFVSFLWYYYRNIITYKGFSLGFTGADGSGKSTVINAIEFELKKVYPAIELFHFRPNLTPNLGDAAQKVKIKSDVDRDYSVPHRGDKTGKLSSIIRLLYYSIDYQLGYFLRVRPFLFKRHIVIFDRYYTDVVADSRRSRIFIHHKFLYWFGKILIPKLDYNILLTADKEVILKRKQELTADGIVEINKKLDYLSNKKGFHLVLNNDSPTEAVQKIINLIFEQQHKKNIKRLKT